MHSRGIHRKELFDRTKCDNCKKALVFPRDKAPNNSYFNLLSRGGLTIPNASLSEFVINAFAVLDTADRHQC